MNVVTNPTLPRPVFIADSSFCCCCGSILPVSGSAKTVSCPLCLYEQDAIAFENQVEYTIKYFSIAKKRDKAVQEASGDGPLADRNCARCGHDEMTYTTQQTRSADEGQTVFYTCPKCKYKETENS